MMPNTSVSPAAMRKSITPNWTPFRACSRTRYTARSPCPRFELSARLLPLHPAVLVVRVLVLLEDGLLDLHLDRIARALDRLQEVVVLDREVVDVVRVRAARGLVIGFPHRGDHALLILQIALDGADRRVDQHDAVVALRAVERRRFPGVLLPVVADVLLVGGVLQIRAPVARLEVAERGVLHRGQRELVHR